MAVTGPNTGFKIVNADDGPYTQDLGQRYVSKDYLLDVYPNIAYEVLGNRTSPGLWTMGRNEYGQLGLGDLVHRSSPVQVGSLTDWKLVSCGGYATAAIKTDGTLWIWGDNTSGKLGLRDLVHRSSPVQVGSLTNWKQVSTGCVWNMAAIKTDGTLWTWGANMSAGALGQNSATDRSSPVQVGSLTNWKQVSAGSYSMAAVKTDGTLWTWGDNSVGQLGQNISAATDISSPVQVGTLTNWKQVSAGDHTAAVKTDGTLWTWGQNNNGQLGLEDLVHRSSPTQVGSLTNWKQVTVGSSNIAALKTDGTLWTWGNNTVGELGLNDLTKRSSPTQVGSLTNWKFVSSIDGTNLNHMVSLKVDGSLWVWGRNVTGRLGLNDTAGRSSPTQVGTLSYWRQISGGDVHTMSILDWSV